MFIINFVITQIAQDEHDASEIIYKIVQIFVYLIAIIVVAVPEGLPLVAGISLADAAVRMKEDNILVKNFEAPETMGGVEEIITSKTASLTLNEMTVKAFYIEEKGHLNRKKNTFMQSELEFNNIEITK